MVKSFSTSRFNELIQQAVHGENASFYDELSETLQWELAIAALREEKTLANEVDYPGLNDVLAQAFEQHGSVESLQSLYDYFVRMVIQGNGKYEAAVAYAVDLAIERAQEQGELTSEELNDWKYEWKAEVIHG